MNHEKDLILVDLDDRPVGSGDKTVVHKKGLLHRAFSVFLFDGDRLLIQRRAEGKYHSAGLWANTCCSHPRRGQILTEAAQMRLYEECGIRDAKIRKAGSFVYRAVFQNGLTEYEYDHVFVGTYSGAFVPDPEEISEMKYVPLAELKQDMIAHPEQYAVWFFTAFKIAEEMYNQDRGAEKGY